MSLPNKNESAEEQEGDRRVEGVLLHVAGGCNGNRRKRKEEGTHGCTSLRESEDPKRRKRDEQSNEPEQERWQGGPSATRHMEW